MAKGQEHVRLNAYHDGELSPAERSAVEAHLRHCPSCAAELAEMRRLSGAFASTAPLEPTNEQLLELAQSVRVEQSEALMLMRLFRGAAVAAAVVLACAAATSVYLGHRARAAAQQALVLNHAVSLLQPADASGGAIADGDASDQQVRLARWIADDLAAERQERP